MEFNIKFSIDSINALLTLIGEVPTKYGLYPFLTHIRAQADEQVAKEAANQAKRASLAKEPPSAPGKLSTSTSAQNDSAEQAIPDSSTKTESNNASAPPQVEKNAVTS